MSNRKRFKRVFMVGLCGDWVEIYKVVPPPRFEGEFLLAFRKKRKRSILPLFSGITVGGVEDLVRTFKQRHFDWTNILLSINSRSQDKMASLIHLA